MSGQIEIKSLEKAVRVGAKSINKYAKDLKDLGETITGYRSKYGDLPVEADGSGTAETGALKPTDDKKKDPGEISYYDRLVNAVSKSADKVRKLKAAVEAENKKLARYQLLEEQEKKEPDGEAAEASADESDASDDLDRMLSVDEDDSEEEQNDEDEDDEEEEVEEVENEADKINAIAQRYGSLSNVAIDASNITDENLSRRFAKIMNTDRVLLDAGEKQMANELASMSPAVNAARIFTTLKDFLHQSRKNSNNNTNNDTTTTEANDDDNNDNNSSSNDKSDANSINLGTSKDAARFLYVQGRQWVHRNTMLVRTIATDRLKVKIHKVPDCSFRSQFGAVYVHELLHALRQRVLFAARTSEGYHIHQVMRGNEAPPTPATTSTNTSTSTGNCKTVPAGMIAYDHKKQRKEGFTTKLVELMGAVLTHEQDCHAYSSFYFLSCCLQTSNITLFMKFIKDVAVLCRSFDTTALICGVALALHDLCLRSDQKGKEIDLSFRCLSTITVEQLHTACKSLLPRREEVAFCLLTFAETLNSSYNGSSPGESNGSDVDAWQEYFSVLSQHLLVFLCYFCEPKQWSTQSTTMKASIVVDRCKDVLHSLTLPPASWRREQQKILIRETGLWSTLYNSTSATSMALLEIGIQIDTSEASRALLSGILMESQVIDSDAMHGVFYALSCKGINKNDYLQWKAGEGEQKCTSLLAARIRQGDMSDDSSMQQAQERLDTVFTFLESFLPSEYSTLTVQPGIALIDREYGWQLAFKGGTISLDSRISMRMGHIMALLSNMTSTQPASTSNGLEESYMVDVQNAAVVSSAVIKKEALVVSQQDVDAWQDMKHLFVDDTTWAHVRTSNAEMNRHSTLLHALLGYTSLPSDTFYMTLVRLSHLNKLTSETLLEDLGPILKELRALLLCAVMEAVMFLLCCYVKARMRVYLEDIHASLSIINSKEMTSAYTLATTLKKSNHLKRLATLLRQLPGPWCSQARANVANLLSMAFSTQYALCMAQSRTHPSSPLSYILVQNRGIDAVMMETLRRQALRLPVFVINLDRRVDRMRKLCHWMEAVQMLAIRVQAVDVSAVSTGNDDSKTKMETEMEIEEDTSKLSISQKNQLLFSRYFKLLCTASTIDEISDEYVSFTWDSTLNATFDTDCEVKKETPMTKSERACAASHLKVWLAIAQLRSQLFSAKQLPSIQSPSPSLLESESTAASLYSQDDLREGDTFLHVPLSAFNASRLGGGWDNFQSNTLPMHKKKKARKKEEDAAIQNVHHLGNHETNDGDWYLILEDDATLTNDHRNSYFRRHLSSLMKYIPGDWDLLYLGHAAAPRGKGVRIGGKVAKGGGKFFQAKYVWQLHAYIIRGRSVDKLLRHLPIKGPVDNFVARLIHDKKLVAYTLQEQMLMQDGATLWERLKTSDITHSGRKTSTSYQAMEAKRMNMKRGVEAATA